MQVPFLDLGAAYQELKPEIGAAISRVLEDGWYILGPEVEAFEREFAAFCSASHAVGVANGLDALILALRALDIGPGDDVIVPSNTYVATWLAVTAVGATPVPVEPDPQTHNIDPQRIAAAITPATKALLPVHLYGQPADLAPIIEIARSHGLAVVEDAAQAHGARYHGQRIGAHGDIACWSFYPGKNLGAFGDGGAITTNRADLAEKIATLRNYGSRTKYKNEVLGVNSRLDPIQAAALSVKLKHLENWNERRRQIAAHYQSALSDCGLTLPHCPDWADPVWHIFVVRASERARLQDHLTAKGIGTLIHYPIAPHMQEAYSSLGIDADSLPLARDLSNEVLSLPIGPQMTDQAVDAVMTAVKQFYL